MHMSLKDNFGNFMYFTVAVFVLSSFGFVNAQSSKPKVVSIDTKMNLEVKQGNLLSVDSARIEKTTVRENKRLIDVFQLSFYVPFEFESLISKSKPILTAYNENGSVKGMKIWRAFADDFKHDNSAKPIPFSLDLSSDFITASSFRLDFVTRAGNDGLVCSNLAGGCRDCADLAIEVCGAGKVSNVKCPKDGSCEFTCKP
jgi:hypothetical protein